MRIYQRKWLIQLWRLKSPMVDRLQAREPEKLQYGSLQSKGPKAHKGYWHKSRSPKARESGVLKFKDRRRGFLWPWKRESRILFFLQLFIPSKLASWLVPASTKDRPSPLSLPTFTSISPETPSPNDWEHPVILIKCQTTWISLSAEEGKQTQGLLKH